MYAMLKANWKQLSKWHFVCDFKIHCKIINDTHYVIKRSHLAFGLVTRTVFSKAIWDIFFSELRLIQEPSLIKYQLSSAQYPHHKWVFLSKRNTTSLKLAKIYLLKCIPDIFKLKMNILHLSFTNSNETKKSTLRAH